MVVRTGDSGAADVVSVLYRAVIDPDSPMGLFSFFFMVVWPHWVFRLPR